MKKKLGCILILIIIPACIVTYFFFRKEQVTLFEEYISSLNVSEAEQISSIISSEEAFECIECINDKLQHNQIEGCIINTMYMPNEYDKEKYQYALYTSRMKHKNTFEVKLKVLAMHDGVNEYILAAWLENSPDVTQGIIIKPYLLEDSSTENVICVVSGYTISIKGPRNRDAEKVAFRNGYYEGVNREYTKAYHVKYVGNSIFVDKR